MLSSMAKKIETVDDMKAAQTNDITLEKYREYAKSGTWKLENKLCQSLSWKIICSSRIFSLTK